MSDKIFKDAQGHMEKALEAFQREVSKMRTGRASLNLLDDIRVEYYGQYLPLNQVATLGVPEPRMIMVTPWESNIIPAIEKAIEKANIGLNPVNDGKAIRLPIPTLTEERRRDFVKMLKSHGEESRVAIRQSRREALDVAKKLEKEGKMTEDDSKKLSTQIQKLTDDFVAKIDAVVANKEKEILQV
ncbi:MAG TPA: ribosome recycling factor [Deltaproteobacteria bacterium]|nr:MAG: ribosome recycling factor [Deltaproteobacteria bacterium GWA2_45_12]HBF11788.1 ribosome recycling factor [Deltaproteobacteria bacterium]